MNRGVILFLFVCKSGLNSTWFQDYPMLRQGKLIENLFWNRKRLFDNKNDFHENYYICTSAKLIAIKRMQCICIFEMQFPRRWRKYLLKAQIKMLCDIYMRILKENRKLHCYPQCNGQCQSHAAASSTHSKSAATPTIARRCKEYAHVNRDKVSLLRSDVRDLYIIYNLIDISFIAQLLLWDYYKK